MSSTETPVVLSREQRLSYTVLVSVFVGVVYVGLALTGTAPAQPEFIIGAFALSAGLAALVSVLVDAAHFVVTIPQDRP